MPYCLALSLERTPLESYLWRGFLLTHGTILVTKNVWTMVKLHFIPWFLVYAAWVSVDIFSSSLIFEGLLRLSLSVGVKLDLIPLTLWNRSRVEVYLLYCRKHVYIIHHHLLWAHMSIATMLLVTICRRSHHGFLGFGEYHACYWAIIVSTLHGVRLPFI